MTSIDFDRLFEALPSPHMVLDRDFNFVAVNRAYEEAMMQRRESLVGGNLFARFPNDGPSGQRLRASIEHVFRTGERDTLAYMSYAIPRPAEAGGGFEERFWTAVHTPLFGDDGAVAFVLQNTVDVTEIVRLREAASLPFRSLPGAGRLLERVREAERTAQEKTDESDEFRRLFQQAPGLIAVLLGPDHTFTFANDAYLKFIGGREVLGLPIREAIPEIQGQGYFKLLDEVYASGVSKRGEGVRVLLRQSPDGEPQEAFVDFTYQPLNDQNGERTGIFVQGTDQTESVRARQRQQVMIDELNHRVKNTLATVQSIARQSFRPVKDSAGARRAFEGRLVALSKAHDVLSSGHWECADLRPLLQSELRNHGEDRTAMRGPRVRLSPKETVSLAIIFHELASNAVRYGALSGQAGRVSVEWSKRRNDGRDRLRIGWLETGGPRASEPARKGFGMPVIQRIVEAELGGCLMADYRPDGYAIHLDFPLSTQPRNAQLASA